jgi:chromosome segregation ATPase
MEQKNEKLDVKEEARILRKKIKRVEESRSAIKNKNREKGTVIRKSQDRQKELEDSRNQWKAKYKEKEKESTEISEKYAYIASLFEIKEEQLRQVLKDFEELKKKYPTQMYQ